MIYFIIALQQNEANQRLLQCTSNCQQLTADVKKNEEGFRKSHPVQVGDSYMII